MGIISGVESARGEVAVLAVTLGFGVLTGMAFLTGTGVSLHTGVEVAGRSVMNELGAVRASLLLRVASRRFASDALT